MALPLADHAHHLESFDGGWELEAAGYTVFVQAWDFRPGQNFVHQMQQGASACARTVASPVTNISPSFIEWVSFVSPDKLDISQFDSRFPAPETACIGWHYASSKAHLAAEGRHWRNITHLGVSSATVPTRSSTRRGWVRGAVSAIDRPARLLQRYLIRLLPARRRKRSANFQSLLNLCAG